MSNEIGMSAVELRWAHAQRATAPPDIRPYRAQSAGGPERVCGQGNQTVLRQIGWHGQSGAFYALDEDPSKHELGSFSPLYIEVGD